MTGPTHKQYSITFAFLAAILLYDKGLTSINYYLSLPIILQVSKYGARFPDFDHNWNSISDKSIPTKIINTIIRITGGKHRSWQTHSIDILSVVMIVSIIFPGFLLDIGKISEVNKEVLSILMISFSAGWLSHIVADMMTSGGVRITCLYKRKVALVPKKIGKLKFNTGNEWEAFVYKVVKIVNIGLGSISLIYPWMNEIIVNITKLIKLV